MITADEARALREAGAIGDTNGIFFDRTGRPVDHELNRRTIAAGFQDLARARTVLLSAGPEKTAATAALLGSGAISGLIIDGDSALALAGRAAAGEGAG
jgi:DNA-binding transcriptional regulator LsrR (DeoR family)